MTNAPCITVALLAMSVGCSSVDNNQSDASSIADVMATDGAPPVDAPSSAPDASMPDEASTDASDDAGDTGDGAVAPVAASVYDIDTGAVATGTNVDVDGVYVIAVDAARRNLWIADTLLASAYRGIYVYRGSTAPVLAVGVNPGVKIHVDHTLAEVFKGLEELGPITNDPLSQTITVVPSVGTPTPASVSAATFVTNGIPYYGSLIKMTLVKVTLVNNGILTLSDGTHSFEMGNQIYGSNATVGTCFATLTGIATLDTAPQTSVPMILPRTASDLVTGTGCP